MRSVAVAAARRRFAALGPFALALDVSPVVLRRRVTSRATPAQLQVRKAAADATRAVVASPSVAAAVVTAAPVDAMAAAASPALPERSAITARAPSTAQMYWKLSKGKLTIWVALSAMPGYFLALPGAIDPVLLAALASGTVMTSSSAQTMNQLIEVDRDARMKRTAQRPLPSGRMSRAEASMFAMISGTAGLGILAAGASPATAALAGATMVTYAAIYTPMKVLSPYNTHVGAIAGSLPTVMGFTAALGGAGLAASPWAAHAAWIFCMQTLWQMPHFYALAWIHRADYLRGGYNMFPLKDDSGVATGKMCRKYLVALCALPWAAAGSGIASWMLPVGAALPSALWWHSLRSFEAKPSLATCRRFFLGSLSYLLAMLGLFTCYAHVEVETPATTSIGTSVQIDGSESALPSSAQQSACLGTDIVGPSWRAAVHEQLLAVCPHEQVRHWFFGIGRDACPFSTGGGR
eukprot:TRINITY_DN31049_c0_g1_i1.p1 TRINITY_DN31049_c0_g1~~TRINITY_DN31049_c0_g1_i1.p1  ORF type:complete len:465 (+),score=67.31 TRINITY_DN31049_c0_g1_i1:119-1513(+)